MNRLANCVSQTNLRNLAIKHGMHNANSSEKIDSPLKKINANGSVTCVICRSNLKSVSLWKVHINSKAHKNNVKEAKQMKDKILNIKTPSATPIVSTPHSELPFHKSEGNIAASNHIEKKPTSNKVKVHIASKDLQSPASTSCDTLPEEFFDTSAAEAKARNAEINAAEWEQFQKEIQEVSRVSHEIFVNDQKNLAVEKEIVEINEQIKHWSKVLYLEDKRQRLHQIVEKKNGGKATTQEDEVSSEDENFEEYPDWRSKGFK